MGVLQDFERRLEGAVEGFFARVFRSGIQPVELAKALQRYAKDEQRVAADGVVVPNVFRIAVGTKDHERLAGYGESLPRELGEVVARTAAERGWLLRGPVKVRVMVDPEVPLGRFRLAGRIEAVVPGRSGIGRPVVDDAANAAPGGRPDAYEAIGAVHAAAVPDDGADAGLSVGGLDQTQVVSAAPLATRALVVRSGEDVGRRAALTGARLTIGRAEDSSLVLSDSTVSREHAALVLRGDTWWVVDLGSTNGVRVNGLRTSEQPLGRGDRIEFGDVVVELVDG
jgi:hypothetical protein